MSALAVVPTSVNDWRRPQTSADPNVSSDLRTGIGGPAPIEQACGRTLARGVLPRRPPHRSFVSELVRPDEPAWKREAAIQVDEPRGDVGVHAIPHDAAALVLVEAEQQRQLEESPRLRAAFRDRVGDASGNRIRRARRVLLFVPEERSEVARRRETDAEDERILHRVPQARTAAPGRNRSSRKCGTGRVCQETASSCNRQTPNRCSAIFTTPPLYAGRLRIPMSPRQTSPWPCRATRADTATADRAGSSASSYCP